MGLAGDHSEGEAAGREDLDRRAAPLAPAEFAAELDRALERWDSRGDELDDLEELLDRDERMAGGADEEGLFSADGRRALRAAIARRREA